MAAAAAGRGRAATGSRWMRQGVTAVTVPVGRSKFHEGCDNFSLQMFGTVQTAAASVHRQPAAKKVPRSQATSCFGWLACKGSIFFNSSSVLQNLLMDSRSCASTRQSRCRPSSPPLLPLTSTPLLLPSMLHKSHRMPLLPKYLLGGALKSVNQRVKTIFLQFLKLFPAIPKKRAPIASHPIAQSCSKPHSMCSSGGTSLLH